MDKKISNIETQRRNLDYVPRLFFQRPLFAEIKQSFCDEHVAIMFNTIECKSGKRCL